MTYTLTEKQMKNLVNLLDSVEDHLPEGCNDDVDSVLEQVQKTKKELVDQVLASIKFGN